MSFTEKGTTSGKKKKKIIKLQRPTDLQTEKNLHLPIYVDWRDPSWLKDVINGKLHVWFILFLSASRRPAMLKTWSTRTIGCNCMCRS
ncbi:unnamed protein product [Linum trigynum]|uniref:Uncharacterized protein n=1 Tax=Linum trigynum TaxID=586398 RepID=A0AAV2EJJ8_9ROSI